MRCPSPRTTDKKDEQYTASNDHRGGPGRVRGRPLAGRAGGAGHPVRAEARPFFPGPQERRLCRADLLQQPQGRAAGLRLRPFEGGDAPDGLEPAARRRGGPGGRRRGPGRRPGRLQRPGHRSGGSAPQHHRPPGGGDLHRRVGAGPRRHRPPDRGGPGRGDRPADRRQPPALLRRGGPHRHRREPRLRQGVRGLPLRPGGGGLPQLPLQ